MAVCRPGPVLLAAVAAATVVRAGHELPVYPSYYPHEIRLRTVAPQQASSLLRDGRLHAYLGADPGFVGTPPETVRAVESLGSLLVLRANPDSRRGQDAACAVAGAVMRAIAGRDVVLHPYPVTPLHGDFLHHADLAQAARARLLAADGPPPPDLKVRADGAAKALLPPHGVAGDGAWDAELIEVDVAGLLRPLSLASNGWQGAPWIRSGWFHAWRALAGAGMDADAVAMLRRLQADAFASAVERINAERDLVTALTAGCRALVVGYRAKREFINVEFSAGIENVAFDAIDGLNAPIFLRTAKLKDYPWNGVLSLGMSGGPEAAWNPIAGFGDAFGRLLWSAVGDPAAIPSPYDSQWVLNRIPGIESQPPDQDASP